MSRHTKCKTSYISLFGSDFPTNNFSSIILKFLFLGETEIENKFGVFAHHSSSISLSFGEIDKYSIDELEKNVIS